MLDPSQDTISLEQVRCCGTEEQLQRKHTPSAQVFEYVVFRRALLKEVCVVKKVKPVQQSK